jgi:cysteine synthase
VVRDESGNLQSVKRALTALEVVADAGEIGVSELGRQLGVHKATASRLAAALANRDLLERNPQNDRYRIGFGLVRLAGSAIAGLDIVREAHPLLESLAEQTRETANLGVLSGDSVVYIDQVTGTRSVVAMSWVGRRTPLHCTSNGKVLLAFAPETDRDRFLAAPMDRFSANTIVDASVLRTQLDEVRARGYAQTIEELEEGLNAVAAPVRRADGRVAAAISVSGPAFRMRGIDLPRMARFAMDAADAISHRRRRAETERRVTDWGRSRRPADSLLDTIGATPLVRLARVAPTVELFAKVEWFGPTGSVKDRIYARMLAAAERRGELRRGMTIIECTTGNAGIACAAVAAIKGYACTIVMPEGMSPERKRMIELYGAELILTPGAGTDIDLALQRMRELVAADPDRYFFPGEFENPENPAAQQLSGEEIWEQTGGVVGAVVAAPGTGGWITGVARALKAHGVGVVAYAVEPAESPLISEERWGTHGVPGIGDGIVPPNLDLSLMDGIVVVSTEEALGMALRLARDEGMLCGPSSGMNVVAAMKVAEKHPELPSIVTVIADTGQRYLSGELFGEGSDIAEPDRDHALDAATTSMLREHRARLEFIS